MNNVSKQISLVANFEIINTLSKQISFMND